MGKQDLKTIETLQCFSTPTIFFYAASSKFYTHVYIISVFVKLSAMEVTVFNIN